jgi:hypothetical protein
MEGLRLLFFPEFNYGFFGQIFLTSAQYLCGGSRVDSREEKGGW